MGKMIQAELMKVRTRWMPYLLVIVALAGVSLQIWLGGYIVFTQSDNGEDTVRSLYTLALPWSLPTLLDAGQYWGAILVGVLTASVISTDFNWGTVRQSLIRGHTRGEYLLSKFLALAIMASIGLLFVLAVGVASSVLATWVAGESVQLHVPGGPSLPELGLMILRAGYAVLPYGLLAFMVSVLTRSTAAGTTAVLLYVFIESAVLGILGSVGGSWADLRGLLLGHNVSAVLAANHIGNVHEFNSLAFRPQPSIADLPGAVAGALVIAIYCLIFAAITYWAFTSRDVRSTDGG